jgi:hypothetical protein
MSPQGSRVRVERDGTVLEVEGAPRFVSQVLREFGAILPQKRGRRGEEISVYTRRGRGGPGRRGRRGRRPGRPAVSGESPFASFVNDFREWAKKHQPKSDMQWVLLAIDFLRQKEIEGFRNIELSSFLNSAGKKVSNIAYILARARNKGVVTKRRGAKGFWKILSPKGEEGGKG